MAERRRPGGVATEPCGTCFGFAIRSPLPFHYLRDGEGDSLEISLDPNGAVEPDATPLLDWKPTADSIAARLYGDESAYRLWVETSGLFSIHPPAGRITVPDEPDAVRREERIWGLPAVLCFLARGDLPLHAAAVEVDGEALVFGGPRAVGKTTLAAAFAAAGHRLLSEDIVCLRLGESPSVIPGPAMIRLRHDVGGRVDVPGATVLGDEDDRVHLALDPETRGTCEPVPLRGVVLLRVCDEGLDADPVPAAFTLRDLWPLSFNVPTETDRARCFNSLAGLASAVPIWNVHRPLRFDELQPTVEFLAALG